MKEIVVVERRLAEPTALEVLERAEARIASCFEEHGVRPLRSYVSLDERTYFCLYEAPDAERVRHTQRRAGLETRRVWTADVLGGGPAGAPCWSGKDGYSLVVVEREVREPMTLDALTRCARDGAPCLEAHRVTRLVSHLARDGMRMFCVFDAPDAESVRLANRQLGMPLTRAWPARLITPPS